MKSDKISLTNRTKRSKDIVGSTVRSKNRKYKFKSSKGAKGGKSKYSAKSSKVSKSTKFERKVSLQDRLNTLNSFGGMSSINRMTDINAYNNVTTPMIKHNNSEAKLSSSSKQMKKNSSYGLFYSPREISSNLQKGSNITGSRKKGFGNNISTSYTMNMKSRSKATNNVSNLTDKLDKFQSTRSKYMKKLGKKSPIFDIGKGLFSKKQSR